MADGEITSLQAVLFYLVAYGFATIGAFAVVTLVRDAGGEATHLSHWAGLGRSRRCVAGVFAFFLLAFAGIPLTAASPASSRSSRRRCRPAPGRSSWSRCWCSAIAAFFYVRVIVLMFFSDPVGRRPDGGGAQRADHGRHRARCRRRRWCSASCPGRSSTWRPMQASSSVEPTPAPAAGLAPADPRRGRSPSALTARLAEVEDALRDARDAAEAPFVTEAAAAPRRRRRQAVPAAAGAAGRRVRAGRRRGRGGHRGRAWSS